VIHRRQLARQRDRAQRTLIVRADGREQFQIAVHVAVVDRRHRPRLRDDRIEAERHHGDDHARCGDGVAGELFQKRLDRLRLVQRFGDPAFGVGERDGIE